MKLRERSYLYEMAPGGGGWKVTGHGGHSNSLYERAMGPFVKQMGMFFLNKIEKRLYVKSLMKFYHGYGNANISGVGKSKNGDEIKWDFVIMYSKSNSQFKVKFEYHRSDMWKPSSHVEYIEIGDNPVNIINVMVDKTKNL